MKRCAPWRYSTALLFTCFSLTHAATETIPLKSLPPNTRYAIWGDSITEVTKYVEIYLAACAGRKDIKVCTFGHSGETAGGLISRQTDLEAFHPTLVSFDWGMNDTQYSPYTDAKGAGYDKDTRASLALLAAKGIPLKVVVSPSYVDDTYGADNPSAFWGKVASGGQTAAQGQNATLGHFRDFARAAAVDTGSGFADVYNCMKDAYLAAEKVYGPKYEFAIHVTPNGALMIAFEILKSLGCDGAIGTFDVDMKGSAHVSDGHTLVSFSNGVLVVDSSKYPFCYNYDPANKVGPNSLDSILPYLPFSSELNRFILKVSNLGAPSANVTWGSETKTFTSDQLAQGINLAEQFDQTPFDATFAKVMAAILNKQDFEDFMIKGTSNYFGNDNGGNVDTNTIAIEDQKDAAVKALIVPVRQTIVIVPTGQTGPAAPVITGTMAAYATVGQAFTYQTSTLNTPTGFAATGLPKGLSIDATSGQITGTPTDPGTSTVQLTATNAQGTGTSVLTLNVDTPLPERPQITSPAVASATVGAPFTYQITSTNNPTDYFVTTQGSVGTEPPDSSLPPGLTYDTKSGLFSGTPTKAGTYPVQVAAMNAAGVAAEIVTLTVKDK
jgi:PKD repeat protein